MNGWCPICECRRDSARVVLRPQWLEKPIPHYDFGCFIEVDLCDEGHALRGLCIECGLRPSREGVDECATCWPVEADEPVRRDNDKTEAAMRGNATIAKLGLSGAQYGAAKNIAFNLYRMGPIGVMTDKRVADRKIQVSKNFPVQP